ncbi:HepT-like ribonuclease domain-containing protein [Spirosoma foliorum]|uniref:DUF86 domain-containing protein n=1 Tax=Spirosoma foliorum TaxID=2710596 RepID=A0A7G5GV61_9BACT|nr:HepT-like ribonuclease domain-containing protein [Spirosoma foliorum]QMW02753.1 DUF86 domain-containing protein [Spirosoma foliorum]
MYSGRNLVHICTILECIEKIFIYIDGFSDATALAWANDQLNFNAAWGLLLVIGEESKKIESSLKNEYLQIPWQQLAGMRNYLAHDYRGVDKELVYQTSRVSLVELKMILTDMIDRVDYEEGALIEALESPYYTHIQYLRDKLND